MSIFYVLLSVLIFTSYSHGAPSPPFSPCKADDNKCILSAAKTTLHKILAGDKEMGLELMVPMTLEEVDGSQTILKYKFIDSTVAGLDKCVLKDMELDSKEMKFGLKMSCPSIVVKGNYVMDGRLIVLPVQGKGKFSIIIDVYDITISGSYKIAKGEGGKEYLSIKSYQADAEPIKGVKYEFQNLFNGKTELANSVHKFTNENWKEVTLQFQAPIITSTMKKLVKNTNKFLKAMPMERVFL